MQTWQIHCGDALAVLQTLPADSVHCVVTSPPYFGLRDYGTGRWEGGSEDCDHAPRAQLRGTFDGGQPASLRDKPARECRCGAVRIDNQIGLESSPQAYVSALVAIFREVRRVLRDDGVCWMNLGDSYAGNGDRQTGRNDETPETLARRARDYGTGIRKSTATPHVRTHLSTSRDGLKPKDLMGIPWRVALALQADGWWLRSDVIWHKKSCMPESVTDRPTRSHEYVFLLTKSARYWYDADAIREPMSRDYEPGEDWGGFAKKARLKTVLHGQAHAPSQTDAVLPNPDGANARTVWSLGPEPSTLEHFAVMPRMLARRCILAGCPFDGVVFDPFAGSGTTGVVALEEGRHFVGIELNAKYHAIARERLANVAPLLATEVSA